MAQGHSRGASFLEQCDHAPNGSAREYPTFEETLQADLKARKLFLEIDARRRVQKALRAQSRPLREFRLGDLVYYYHRARKEGSRYGGHWYGPARVLCQEKTSPPSVEGGSAGSVVWISHAGRIVRCSPEQLRRVTRSDTP